MWKILKEIVIPDHFTCLLRKLYGGQEATVRTRHETTEWFTVKKGVCQDCMLSAFLFNICKVHHAKCQAGWSSSWSRLLWEISIISDMQMTPPYGRNLRRTKEHLDESERQEWKSWIKTQHSKNSDHGIWCHHFMANKWGNNGNSDRFYFRGLQNHYRWWEQTWN